MLTRPLSNDRNYPSFLSLEDRDLEKVIIFISLSHNLRTSLNFNNRLTFFFFSYFTFNFLKIDK